MRSIREMRRANAREGGCQFVLQPWKVQFEFKSEQKTFSNRQCRPAYLYYLTPHTTPNRSTSKSFSLLSDCGWYARGGAGLLGKIDITLKMTPFYLSIYMRTNIYKQSNLELHARHVLCTIPNRDTDIVTDPDPDALEAIYFQSTKSPRTTKCL